MIPTNHYERASRMPEVSAIETAPNTSQTKNTAHAFFIYDNADKVTEDFVGDMTRRFSEDGLKIEKICCSGFGNYSYARKKHMFLESLRERVRQGVIGKNTMIFLPLHTYLSNANELSFALNGNPRSLRIPTAEVYDCIWSMFPEDEKPSFHNLGCNSGFQSKDLESAKGHVINYAGMNSIGAHEGFVQATEVLRYASNFIKNGEPLPTPTMVWQHMQPYALQEMSITGRKTLASHDPFKAQAPDSDQPTHQNPVMLIRYALRRKSFDDAMKLVNTYDPDCKLLQQMDEKTKTKILFSLLEFNHVDWASYEPDAADSDPIFHFMARRDAEQKFLFCKENGLLPKLDSSAAADKFLLRACDNGNVRIARHLLNLPDFPISKQGIKTALAASLYFTGNQELIELMLQHTSAMDVLFEGNNTLLHKACMGKNSEAVRLIVSQGHLSRLASEYIDTRQSVQSPAEIYKRYIDIANSQGLSALGIAIQKNDLDSVKLLLEAGANPNLKDANGDTLFHLAVTRGNTEIVMLLLQHGADIDRPDGRGNPALCNAIWKSHDQVAELLIAHYGQMNKRYLINYRNAQASTPLLLAIKKKNLGMLKALIKAGADTTRVDKKGHGLLYWFIKKFHERINVHAENATEHHADDAAVLTREKHAALSALIAAGAPLDEVDDKGNTLLHLAAKAEDTALIKLLVNAGVDLNASNRKGYTVLHYALEKGLHNASRFLINVPVNLSASTFDLETALELALTSNDNYAINHIKNAMAQQSSDSPAEPGNEPAAAPLQKN